MVKSFVVIVFEFSEVVVPCTNKLPTIHPLPVRNKLPLVTLPVPLNTPVPKYTFPTKLLPITLAVALMLPPRTLPETLREVNVPTLVILACALPNTVLAVAALALQLAKFASNSLSGIGPTWSAKIYGTEAIS